MIIIAIVVLHHVIEAHLQDGTVQDPDDEVQIFDLDHLLAEDHSITETMDDKFMQVGTGDEMITREGRM